MERDFTEQSKQKLLALVKEVEDEQWCSATDAIGDFWYGVESFFGALNIKKYLDNLDQYHKKVIDKNDATVDTIEKIFKSVNIISSNYSVRFSALFSSLKSYEKLINELAETVNPANGRFTTNFIKENIQGQIDLFFQDDEVVQKIVKKDLHSEDLQSDSESAKRVCQTIVSYMLEHIPNAKVNEEMEIPIGPDLVFYYKVSTASTGKSDVNFNLDIEENKVKLKNITYSSNASILHGSLNNGEIQISLQNENCKVGLNDKKNIEESGNVTIGDSNISVTYECNPITNEMKYEVKIETKSGGGKVESTAGIRKKANEENWQSLPVMEPVVVPAKKFQSLNLDGIWNVVEVVADNITGIANAILVVVACYGVRMLVLVLL